MAIITISRGTFSGGQSLAECVAEGLGYRCLSREELLTDSASQFAVGAELLSAALDNKPGFLETVKLERLRYITYVRATLLRVVRDDNVVYHGQVGHLLLEGFPHVLRVKVIADMEFRIKAATERHGFSRAEAIKFIRKVSSDRATWVRHVYHVDWHDPLLYDVLFNVASIGIPAATEIVVDTVTKPQFQTPPSFKKVMDDLVLSADIQARIAEQRGLDYREIGVEADGGIVTILGTVDTLHEADIIRVVARNTQGVQEIKPKIKIRYPGVLAGV
ncbi:cytidylate kinase family protein [Chloroflexota bacterium]